MKKIVMLVMALALVSCFSALAESIQDPTTAKKVFAVTGEFQEYVGFSFQVPTGECNNLDVYRWKKGYPFFHQEAEWMLMNPGEVTGPGYYRFVNREEVCNPKFEIRGELTQMTNMPVWGAMEIEPQEIGIFAKDAWGELNLFGLSEDDWQYSYHLFKQGHGMKTSLDIALKDEYFMFMNGEPVGAIVADSRGFVRKVFMPKKVNANTLSKIVFDDDDIAIVIYRENYSR